MPARMPVLKTPEPYNTPLDSAMESPEPEASAYVADVRKETPFLFKAAAVCLVCCISCANHWSSGVTKAMKSTIKTVLITTHKYAWLFLMHELGAGYLQHPILLAGSQ